MEPADNRLPEKEALELIARVFDSQTRRMNRVRGGHFVLWGAVLSLTALLEYGLWRLTGTPLILWSAFIPFICAYIGMNSRDRRQGRICTGFDRLLIQIWCYPAMLSFAAIVYAAALHDHSMNPVGVVQLLLGTALAITSEFYRGKGSQHSGSFAALTGLALAEMLWAFEWTFRAPFDFGSGTWLLELAAHGVLLLLLPGLILQHITRKSCSRS